MSGRFFLLAAASFVLGGLSAAPAAAGVTSFVSGKGVDAGDCSSPATPCRTFQFALKQTAAGGEIKALDPANYFAVTINKSISIVGVEGAGILRSTSGNAITVAAGASDRIQLRGLSLEGFGSLADGVRIASAGTVEIVDCVIRRFVDGIAVVPGSGTLKFLVSDTLLSSNRGDGLSINSPGTAAIRGLVQRTKLANNGSGGMTLIVLENAGATEIRVVDSAAESNRTGFDFQAQSSSSNAQVLLDRVTSSGNSFAGLSKNTPGVVRIARSIIVRNTSFGLIVDGAVESFGDNVIRGNGGNVGTLTTVGLQ